MKKTKSLMFFSFVCMMGLLYTNSCSTSDNATNSKQLKEIVIDVNEESLSSNDLITKYKIFIDANDKNSPKFYEKIVARNDTLFILDDVRNQGVYAYSMKGEALFHFNNIGKGEKQCRGVCDMTIGKSCIYITDYAGDCLASIDMKGEFINKKKFKKLSMRTHVDEKNNVIYCDNNNSTSHGRDHSLYIYQKDSICTSFLPIPKEIENFNFSTPSSFSVVGNDIHYCTGLRDTIYNISPNSVKPIYHLNFGKEWPSKDFIKSAVNKLGKFNRMLDGAGLVSSVGFFESDNIIALNFFKGDEHLVYVYNKRKNKHQLYKFERLNKLVGLYGDDLIFAERGKKNDKIEILRIDWKR